MSERLLQVNSVISHALGEILSRDIELPLDLLATVTDVDTASNLKTANVKISVLPFSKTREALAMIIRQRAEIQRQLARKVDLQFTPVMRFLADDTPERVSEINRLIDEAQS